MNSSFHTRPDLRPDFNHLDPKADNVVPSAYNLFCTLDDGRTACYNSMYGSVAIIPPGVLAYLRDSGQAPHPDMLRRLMKLGLIIPSDFSERAFYATAVQRLKWTPRATNIMLVMLYRCNLKCSYCVQDWGTRPGLLSDADAAAIRTFVSQTIEQDRSQSLLIDYFGGEPLLAWQRMQTENSHYRTWCAEHGVKYQSQIYTNGTICNDDILSGLQQFNLMALQITLDGDRTEHNKRRPFASGQGTYDIILDNIERFSTAGLPVAIRVNFDNTNTDSVPALLTDLRDRGLERTCSVYFYGIETATDSCSTYAHAVTDDQYAEIQEQLLDFAFSQGFNHGRISLPAPRYIYCAASTVTSHVVDFKRNVYKCACLQGYEEHKVGSLDPAGNLQILPLFYSWMSRDPLSLQPCTTCRLLPLCGGGCMGTAQGYHGTFHTANCRGISEQRIIGHVKRYLQQQLAEQTGKGV